MKFSILAKRGGQTRVAEPGYIRDDVIIIGKNKPWRKDDLAEQALIAPFLQDAEQIAANVLMIEVGLFGHEELCVDDLVAFPVGREGLEISRCPTKC
jgi:hypothetical protein